MVNKPKNRANDEHLFREQMGDVVPLKTEARSDSKIPSPPKRRNDPGPRSSVPKWQAAIGNTGQKSLADDLSYSSNGIQNRIMKKLKRGHYPVTAQLDLHQMNTETAHGILLGFMADNRAQNPVCVRIIHGKGLRSENGPRLKPMVRQLLRDHPFVLAYVECKPADGGAGATDVLLRSI